MILLIIMNILQIGTNDGNDHVFEFIKTNENSIKNIILIEPIFEKLNEAKNTYSNIKNTQFICAAITPNPYYYIQLYVPKNLPDSQTASIYESHTLSHVGNHQGIEKRIVPCIGINVLLEIFKFEILDYLFIDTEGLDCDLILSLDLIKNKILNIIYESAHSDGSYKSLGKSLETKKYLINNNYTVDDNDRFSTKAKLMY